MDAQERGRWGEDAVARALAAAGYEILARNVRLQRGELDLVARRGKVLWFVECKSRGRRDRGAPHRAIDARKRRALFAAAREYLVRRGDRGAYGFLAAWVLPAPGDGAPCVRWEVLPINPRDAAIDR